MIEDFKDFIAPFLKEKYKLVRITQFGDFEVREEEEILKVASSKEELTNYCKEKGIELDDPSGWNPYYIAKGETR